MSDEPENELTVSVTKTDTGDLASLELVHQCDENSSIDFSINSNNETSATIKVKF